MSQEKLYNQNSIYTHCNECKMFGINLPKPFDDKTCGNCGSRDTLLYYSENDVDYAVQERRDHIMNEAMKKFEDQ